MSGAPYLPPARTFCTPAASAAVHGELLKPGERQDCTKMSCMNSCRSVADAEIPFENMLPFKLLLSLSPGVELELESPPVNPDEDESTHPNFNLSFMRSTRNLKHRAARSLKSAITGHGTLPVPLLRMQVTGDYRPPAHSSLASAALNFHSECTQCPRRSRALHSFSIRVPHLSTMNFAKDILTHRWLEAHDLSIWGFELPMQNFFSTSTPCATTPA